MFRLCGWLALAAVALAPLPASAQAVLCPVPITTVSYYAPAPAVTYYAPAPVVAVPVTTYYAPAPVAAPVTVSTYRYGLFGRRSVTTVSYGAPAPVTTYYAPAVVTPRRVTYYRAPVYVYP